MLNKKIYFKDGLFWTIAILVIFVNLFFLIGSINEIYQISFISAGLEYHWGAEPYPWYYENKMIYLTYIGSWTILFSSILAFQVYFIFKNNKTKELYIGLAYIFLFGLMLFLNGSID